MILRLRCFHHALGDFAADGFVSVKVRAPGAFEVVHVIVQNKSFTSGSYTLIFSPASCAWSARIRSFSIMRRKSRNLITTPLTERRQKPATESQNIAASRSTMVPDSKQENDAAVAGGDTLHANEKDNAPEDGNAAGLDSDSLASRESAENDELAVGAEDPDESPGEDSRVNFANLEGVGEHPDSSDEDAPLETIALARLPGQVVSEIQNDEPALTKKLEDIAIFAKERAKESVPFWESLTVTMPLEKQLPDTLAMDDIKREERFAELATAAAHIGLEKLRNQKVKFRRPSDYFAQMVKTDTQMGKVKARILHQKERIESAEKRRNNREIAKNKKKVRSTQLQKEQEKKRKAKEEIEAFSRLRKQRLKERAEGNDNDIDNDNEFPIELLDVEQLDEDNKFRPESEIASGKHKAWNQKSDKLSKDSNHSRNGNRSMVRGGRDAPRRTSGSHIARSPQGAGQNRGKGVAGASGGVRKPKGSKKRLGRSRRKAGAK